MGVDVQPIVVKDVSFWIAFFHGVLAFFTPCMLPLIPFMISLLPSKKNLFGFVLFSLGFIGTFTVMGALSAKLGACIPICKLRVITGVLIIVFGMLFLMGVTVIKGGKILFKVLDNWEKLPAFVLGAALGAVWIPCSTPILASILALAASSTDYLTGTFLLFSYSLGLFIPFVTIGKLVGVVLEKFSKRRLETILRITGGVFMILVGVFQLFGLLNFAM